MKSLNLASLLISQSIEYHSCTKYSENLLRAGVILKSGKNSYYCRDDRLSTDERANKLCRPGFQLPS